MDEMLSGVLHPDANQHMRQCERCTSHFRARATVQNGLRKLAFASVSGPSPATDRAVMESYRRLQQRRALARDSDSVSIASASAAPAVRLFTFPSRNFAPVWSSRTWWTGAAAAAVVFAIFGSAVHLWNGVPSVNAPMAATHMTAHAPSVSAPQQSASVGASSSSVLTANAASARSSQRLAQPRPSPLSSPSHTSQSEVATAAIRSTPPVLAAKSASARPALPYDDGSNYNSSPVTQLSANVPSVIHLASSGAATNVAQSASSTWPGYSNLMYCDPVVCSGPMQVVHIKVPVGQVKPNLGQTTGNAFVNAEVVIGPDGVARAIRVAN
jgi:hypothetical protein